MVGNEAFIMVDMDDRKFVNQICAVCKWLSVLPTKGARIFFTTNLAAFVSNGATIGNNGTKWSCGLVNFWQYIKSAEVGYTLR